MLYETERSLGVSMLKVGKKTMMGTLGCEAGRAATWSKAGGGGGNRLLYQAGGAGKGCVWLSESKDITEVLKSMDTFSYHSHSQLLLSEKP